MAWFPAIAKSVAVTAAARKGLGGLLPSSWSGGAGQAGGGQQAAADVLQGQPAFDPLTGYSAPTDRFTDLLLRRY